MPYVEYDEVIASCSECGRAFRSEEDLEAHKAEVHEAPARGADLTPGHDPAKGARKSRRTGAPPSS
jgi:C2H2-type zinc finger